MFSRPSAATRACPLRDLHLGQVDPHHLGVRVGGGERQDVASSGAADLEDAGGADVRRRQAEQVGHGRQCPGCDCGKEFETYGVWS